MLEITRVRNRVRRIDELTETSGSIKTIYITTTEQGHEVQVEQRRLGN